QANLRNALTEVERLVLEMRYQGQNIGGARVLRLFTFRDRILWPGQHLAADEIMNMAPLDRRVLVAAGYLKIYGQTGDATPYGAIAKEVGLRDRAHAFEIEQSALKKLNKHLQGLRRKKAKHLAYR